MDRIPYFINDQLTLAMVAQILPAHLAIVPFNRGMPHVGRCAWLYRTSLQQIAERFLVEDAYDVPMYRFCHGCNTGHVVTNATAALWEKTYDKYTDAQYYQLIPTPEHAT